MSISISEVSDGGGCEDDPFHGMDFSTAMALLDSTLHQRLGEAAVSEQAGITGFIRTQLQRLWPAKFGAEITPARIGQLFRFIEHEVRTSASHRKLLPWEQQDPDAYVYKAVKGTVKTWSANDLRGYLSEVDGQVRTRGSLSFVLADHDAQAERIFKNASLQDDGL
jgi:hypothetical protein